MRKSIVNKILSGLCNVLWVVLGIVAIVSPQAFANSLGTIAGSFMIIIGALFVLFALFSSALILGSGFLALQGVITLSLGIFFVAYRDASLVMITFALAFYFLFNGISKIVTSVDLAKLKSKTWWVTTIIGVLYIALSIVLFTFTSESSNVVSYLIGSFFIISGVFGVLELVDTFKREKREKIIINNIHKNVDNIDHIDIDFTKDDK